MRLAKKIVRNIGILINSLVLFSNCFTLRYCTFSNPFASGNKANIILAKYTYVVFAGTISRNYVLATFR
jgi:hypothetical protein